MGFIEAMIILGALGAAWGGWWLGRSSAEREAEYARRFDFCYIGGVESDGLPFEHPSHWQCDPKSEDSLRAAGYPFTEEEPMETATLMMSTVRLGVPPVVVSQDRQFKRAAARLIQLRRGIERAARRRG